MSALKLLPEDRIPTIGEPVSDGERACILRGTLHKSEIIHTVDVADVDILTKGELKAPEVLEHYG